MKKFKFIIEVINTETLDKKTVCKGYRLGDGMIILDALNRSLLPGSRLTYKLLKL